MGALIPFDRIPDGALYDRLADRYNAGLEESRKIGHQLDAIRTRFLTGELRVQSGPRKGQPLTRAGRARLWEHLESLYWRQARLFAEQRRLYRQVTGWSEHAEPRHAR